MEKFARSGGRAQDFEMLRVRRSFYWQVAGLVLAIGVGFALSRFFPACDELGRMGRDLLPVAFRNL